MKRRESKKIVHKYLLIYVDISSSEVHEFGLIARKSKMAKIFTNRADTKSNLNKNYERK